MIIYFPEREITQVKRLINHSEWLEVRDIVDDEEYKRRYKQLGDFFTTQSPFYHAIVSGRYICNNVDVACHVYDDKVSESLFTIENP